MPAPANHRTLFGHPVSSLLHLLVVYVVWGSTFLAIRVAVREGAGWDPWSMAGSRLLIAGIVLLLIGRLQKQRIFPRREEWLRLAGYALFIWLIGHGLVVWAEQEVPSGQAALIVGAAPIWGAIIEAIIDRRSPGWRLIGGLILGFIGLMLLLQPVSLIQTHQVSPRLFMVVLGTMAWSAGVVLQGRRKVALSGTVSSGWQQLIASVGFAAFFFGSGQDIPAPSLEAWVAWAYLLVFGSLLAFTSYVIVMKSLPTPVVLTHAYINPAVAVLLGWLILSEDVTLPMLLGASLILLGVAGVFSAKQRWDQPHEPKESPPERAT